MVRGAGRLRVFVLFLFTLIPFILVLFPFVDMWRDVPWVNICHSTTTSRSPVNNPEEDISIPSLKV